jgi:undecaprenyl-diphosphatase
MPRRSPLDLVRALAAPESRFLTITLGIAASSWTFLAIASLVTHGHTQALDEWLLRALRRVDHPAVPIGPLWLQGVALDMTRLGDSRVLAAIVVAAAVYLVAKGRFAMAGFVLATTIGGMLTNPILKGIYLRPRPSVVPALASAHSTSFPSGHSMAAAVVYLTLGALLARTTKRWHLRVAYLSAALALTVLVGLSRIYLGVHYPSDVLAGWCAGALWALVWELVANLLQQRNVLRRPT